jgi:hypothetical protein
MNKIYETQSSVAVTFFLPGRAKDLSPPLHLLYTTATRFGHISWPSLGSYEFGRCAQSVWQIVTDNWRNVRV